MRQVLVLIALASLLAACGPETTASAGPEEKQKVTASPIKDPNLVVGDTAPPAGNGTTLAVLSYRSLSAAGGAKPDKGFEFSGIEVKGCAGPNSENSLMHIGPDAFSLRLSGGALVLPEHGGGKAKIREPILRAMNPLPGECGRGFVAFQTPRGERPEIVLYEEQFVLKDTIAWRVPQKG